MRPTPHARLIVTLAVCGALALLAACSGSKSNPYQPPGGGGGGGGGSVFNFGPFAGGQSAQRTFSTVGNTGYHCVPHQLSGMTGTVQVDALGGDSVVVSIGVGNALTFTPNPAHIKPGGYVRWVNVSPMTNHTVTSD